MFKLSNRVKGGEKAIINGIIKALKPANQLYMRSRVRAMERGGGVGFE
jgi:hypothetical protein